MDSFLLTNFLIHIIFCCTIVMDLDLFNLSCRHLCYIYTSKVYGLPHLVYDVFKTIALKIKKPCMKYLWHHLIVYLLSE